VAAAAGALALGATLVGFTAAVIAAVLWSRWIDRDGTSPGGARSGRVLVCMPPDRDATVELEEGRGLADRLGASLFAACVLTAGTSALESTTGNSMLSANIALAERLGATVVQVRSEDVAAALALVAEREAATHVVLGHSGPATDLWHAAGVVGAFVRLSRGLEIQVVGQPAGTREAARAVGRGLL
jgi:K+-sensing histidine kinase KdpD